MKPVTMTSGTHNMTRSPLGRTEAGLLASACNLDLKNPNAKRDFDHRPPEQLAEDITNQEQRIAEIMGEIKEILGKGVEP